MPKCRPQACWQKMEKMIMMTMVEVRLLWTCACRKTERVSRERERVCVCVCLMFVWRYVLCAELGNARDLLAPRATASSA